MANPVVWFEIMGKNGSDLREFYAELFGWKYELDAAVNYGMVEAAERGIAGGIGENDRTWVTFYVSTPSIDAKLAEVEKKGGRTLMPRTQLPGGTTLAMFADPDGNAIGLVEEAAA